MTVTNVDMVGKGQALKDLDQLRKRREKSESAKSWTYYDERELLIKHIPERYAPEGTDAIIRALNGWYRGFTKRLESGRFDPAQQSLITRADALINICIEQIKKYRKYD
tara:strand:+ start:260 stop:586 length:327 start_codon:yes stop_codon:yes gene_type:complete